MKLRFNLAGTQFLELANSETDYLGAQIQMVHETGNKVSEQALSIQTLNGEHIGYVPEDSYKFKGHQALFDALKFNFPITGVVTEALYKDSAKRFNHITPEKLEAGKKGRGEFVDFEIELDMQAGDDSISYFDESGTEYLRLTRLLEYVKWDPEDNGLEEWQVDRFKDYSEYEKYLQGCAFEGQLIHAKAQVALYKQDLPEGVAPLPPNVVTMIKKVRVVHSVEERVYDQEIGVAGTLDAFVGIGSQKVRTVLDWKRSKQLQQKYLRQIAFYAHCKKVNKAIIVLARADPKDAFVVLQKKDIEKYYDQVYHAAQLVKSIKGIQ